MNELKRAEALFLESKSIIQKELGEQHPDYAAALNNLGQLYAAWGKPLQALPLFLRAGVLVRKIFGDQHPTYGNILTDLAGVYAELGEYDRAEGLFLQALKCLGESNRTALSGLGGVYFAAGKHQDAERCFRRTLEHARSDLELASLIQSERQQHAMLAKARDYLDVYLSVASRAGVPAEDTYRTLLPWKGAVFERQRRLKVAADDPECRQLRDELQETASRLAAAALAVPESGSRDAWERGVAELTDRKERLEAELARRNPGDRAGHGPEEIGIEALRLRLPPKAALLDYLEFTRFEPPRRGQGKLEPTRHFVVFALRRDLPLVQVDLGPAEPIEQAVEMWRLRELPQAAGRGPGKQDRELADRRPSEPQPEDTLRRLVWEPVEKQLDGVGLVLVSPDGALARFPLAALPGKAAGSFLIEELPIAVIPVPQLLPELLDEPAGPQAREVEGEPSWLLVGDVDFGAARGSTHIAAGDTQDAEPERPHEASGEFHRAAPRGLPQWPPLPGSAQEIDVLERLWRSIHPGATVKTLRGGAPTEETIRRLAPQFRYIHLATHGFFAPPEVSSAWRSTIRWLHTLPGKTVDVGPFGRKGIAGWHPGLLSGIALAGASRGATVSGKSPPVSDDGILTALEVATLDMRRTDLVVLSACETGLGRQAGGEGLLGLQRAFQVAGSRTVVASLWKVDDESSRQLMSHFYENLWQKRLSKIEALRQAQLAILRKGAVNSLSRGPGPVRPAPDSSPARHAPPRVWAAWVLSGDPGNSRF
jgi:CHAT domain-containing protein/tetratricopeptide (TPR) repeat protein